MKIILLLLGAVAVCSASSVISVSDNCNGANQNVNVAEPQAEIKRKYAFTVQRETAFAAGALIDSIIPFNVIKRNDDLIYDPHSGVFKAPVKGLYQFHFSAASDSGIMKMDLVSPQAGGNLARASAGATESQASNLVNIELERGWTVFVRLLATHSARACNPACTSFSGQLLEEIK